MSLLPRQVTLPSNAQLSALLDGAAQALLLLDARQRVSFCNHAARQLLGCEAGQALDTVLRWLSPASRSALTEALAAGQAGAGLSLALIGGPNQGRQLGFELTRSPGSGWALRADLVVPLPAMPPLAAGATSDLVRLLWESPQPLLVQDTDFIVVAANRAFYESAGRTPEQVLGRDLMAEAPAEDQAQVNHARQLWQAALAAGRQPENQVERRLVDKQGRQRWFCDIARWVSADDGRPLLLSLLHDTSFEHHARLQATQPVDDRALAGQGRLPLAAAMPSDEATPVDELAQWFQLSPVGMLVYDSAGLVVRSNAAFEALVGCSPVKLSDAPADLRHLLAWEGGCQHADLQPDMRALDVRATVALPTGGRQRLRARLRAFQGEGGALRVMAVVEDRSLEDEHDLAQLEIGALMDTAGVGLATYEASRGWLQSRPSRSGAAAGEAAPAAGLPAGLQAIGRDQVEHESRDEFDRLQRALREGRRAQVRYAVKVPELGLRWLLTRVEPGELTGGRAALSVVTLDVTEQEASRHRGEQLLRELSTILDGTSAGIAYLRGERLLRCNRSFETMLGLSPGSAAGAVLGDLLADQPLAQALLRRALAAPENTAEASEGRHEIEFSRTGPQGGTVWYALSASRAPVGDRKSVV